MDREAKSKFDKYVGGHLKCLERIFRVNLDTSQSRWGFEVLVFAFALFFISPSLWVLFDKLSQEDITMSSLILAFTLLGVGILLLIYGILNAIYFLRNPHKDELYINVGEMKKDTGEMKNELSKINEVLNNKFSELIEAIRESRIEKEDDKRNNSKER